MLQDQSITVICEIVQTSRQYSRKHYGMTDIYQSSLFSVHWLAHDELSSPFRDWILPKRYSKQRQQCLCPGSLAFTDVSLA